MQKFKLPKSQTNNVRTQNQITTNIVKKYYRQGMVNPKVPEILKCNELFCNKRKTNIADGKGGGLLKSLEVVASICCFFLVFFVFWDKY